MKANDLLPLLSEFNALGIAEQIDYKKFYLYSIITHSTAIEGSTVTEAFKDHKDKYIESLATSRDNEDESIFVDFMMSELEASLNITRRAVAKQLKNLQEKGKVRRIGPDKGGHWEVIL